MSLLTRYLHAVRTHLPVRLQDDIIAELGDDLRAQFEEREAALGRALTEDEEAALLKPYGRPLVMAARYRPQQHLIGPALFPYYWATLKTAFSIALVALAALAVSLALAGRPFGQVTPLLWKEPITVAFSIFTWVTLVFAAIEFAEGRVKAWDEWDPRSLPRDTTPVGAASRFDAGLDLVFTALFVAFWAAWPRSEFLRTLAHSGIELAPAWASFYLPILLVSLASMIAKAVILVRPDRTRFRLGTALAGTLAMVVLLSLLLRAGDLVVPTTPVSAHADTLVRIVNRAVRVSFIIAMAIAVGSTAWEVRRYWRARPRTAGVITAC